MREALEPASKVLRLVAPEDPPAAVDAPQARRPGLAAPLWPRIAVIGLAAFLVYFAVRVIRNTELPPRGDFGVYYRAGQDLAAARPLYYTDLGIEETFKSAPAEAAAAAAIAWLPPRLARFVWFVVDVALLGLIFFLSFRMLYTDGRWTAFRGWLLLGAFLLTISQSISQLASGQPTTLWVALSMLAFHWAATGKQGRAGTALAAAVCIKVVPLCFVPHLLLRGRGRLGASFLAGLAALLLLPATWVGWEANRELVTGWVAHLRSTLTPNMLWELRNQSLFALLARFLMQTELGVEWVRLELATVGRIWLVLACGLALTMNAWFALALRGRKTQRREVAILSLLLIFMTICNPLGWRHNAVALVLPYYFVLDSIARSLERRRTLAALLAASLLLTWVRSIDPRYWLAYSLQVYGGRFWSSILLAVAVVVAYQAANVQRIRLAEEPEADLGDVPDSGEQPAVPAMKAAA